MQLVGKANPLVNCPLFSWHFLQLTKPFLYIDIILKKASRENFNCKKYLRCSPRVLDEPVVLASLGTVSNNQDGVVQVVDTVGVSGSVAAQMVIKDTTSIMAPVVGGLHR